MAIHAPGSIGSVRRLKGMAAALIAAQYRFVVGMTLHTLDIPVLTIAFKHRVERFRMAVHTDN